MKLPFRDLCAVAWTSDSVMYVRMVPLTRCKDRTISCFPHAFWMSLYRLQNTLPSNMRALSRALDEEQL